MLNKRLLPVGFYDLLFDEAEKNHKNINDVLDVFFGSGYRLIKTPLVEFEDKITENSFRTTDVISGKNLTFRSDITPQISRLLHTRLSQVDLPLRLCYVGDVLCAKSENLYVDRQQTQLGIELIGHDVEKSNFEVISILLTALKKLNLENLLIEFSLPNFLEIFLNEIVVEQRSELVDAVMRKDLSAIERLAGKNSEIIKKIALSNSDLDLVTKDIISEIKSPKVSQELQRAQNIFRFLKENFAGILVRFDLFGDHVSSYHNNVSFDVFCGDFSYPIARGGTYKVKDLDAVGATIYMNILRKI